MGKLLRAKGANPRGGRPRSGTLEPSRMSPDGAPRFRGRVRLADGTKSDRFDIPAGLDEKQARAYLGSMQAQEDAHGSLLAEKRDRARRAAEESRAPHDLETSDAWFARYLPTKECGAAHRRITSSIWTKWISPTVGQKAIRNLTRDDVEDIRDKLDKALDAKKIRHSTARNAWGVLTGALKSAYAARDRSLRVLESPLHFGVLPPKRGDSRQRPWLYPTEWALFAACPEIPGQWRQACAIALYTGLRPGELRALQWSDVDLKAKTISISKAFDEETGEAKAPKTLQSHRVIPIQENLLPLLTSLVGEAHALVLPPALANGDRIAPQFRELLALAGVNRPRLTADNATEEQIDFRSLRDTHATWLALAGVADKIIQRRLGHASPTTTDRYVKAAESFDREGVGLPFPPLPKEVWSKVWPRNEKSPGFHRGKLVARVGFEPTTFGL
jgi:integrase